MPAIVAKFATVAGTRYLVHVHPHGNIDIGTRLERIAERASRRNDHVTTPGEMINFGHGSEQRGGYQLVRSVGGAPGGTSSGHDGSDTTGHRRSDATASRDSGTRTIAHVIIDERVPVRVF